MSAAAISPSAKLAAKILATPAGRRAVSIKSPEYFDTYYCGMRSATHRTDWLNIIEGTVTHAAKYKKKARLYLEAPRDHGKTEALITIAVRAICLNRDIRILWISENGGTAVKRMGRVRKLLESPRIIEDWGSSPDEGYPPFKDTASKWTQAQMYVPRVTTSVDPTVEAVGSSSSITGGHFDLILIDDLEDDKTTNTEQLREKTRAWFRGTVSPMLVRGGAMIVVGTRKHDDDLYHHLIENDLWEVISDPAISNAKVPDHEFVREPHPRTGKMMVTDVKFLEDLTDFKALWPEERDLKYLMEQRLEMTGRMFAREFLHLVQSDSESVFKQAFLRLAYERGANFELGKIPEGIKGLDIVQGWDLSLTTDARRAAKQDSDYTVGVTWARDFYGDRYLLGIRRIRGVTPASIRAAVIAEFQKFGGLKNVRAVAVERNAFGHIHYMGLKSTTDLPIKPHLTTNKKVDPWEGVPALATLFENGKVVFPSRTEESRERIEVLEKELWGFGTASHDDCVMALWIAETVLRSEGFTHRLGDIKGIYDKDGAYLNADEVAGKRTAAERVGDALWEGIYLDHGDDWDL